MTLCPPNNNLLTISFTLYIQNKISPNRVLLLKRVCSPKLLNDPLTSSSLINLDFLQLHTPLFDKTVTFYLFVFQTFTFLLTALFRHIKQYNNFVS